MACCGCLHKEFIRHQSFLFEEPDKEQARDEANNLHRVCLIGKTAFGNGPLIPCIQLAVELAVEGLGIQNAFPRLVERLKRVNGVGLDEAVQRELGEDVQMRAVRCGQVDVPNQRHLL